VKLVVRLLPCSFLAASLACGQASPPSTNTEAAVSQVSSDIASDSSELAPMNLRVPNARSAFKGASRQNDEMVTVVLKLDEAPVAVVRGAARDRKLPEATEAEIVDRLSRRQNGLRGTIEAMGGNVLATYQHAYNGIKVRISASRIGYLTSLPGVVAITQPGVYHLDNAQSVPYIGAPTVWDGGTGFHGEGIKVAIIDTGLDYTHANFGGPGTVAAYNSAHAAETAAANPALFGPAAPKVKGGTDLVGDDYNANPNDPHFQPTPHPDANPLDCNGHGSHVGGTTAGFGVNTNGSTFAGPYTATTPGTAFRIGPGVAPKADLYGVRVFGCEGSTDVVTEALEWAVANHMQVVNMSLGSNYGAEFSSSAEASTNAANAGIIVVASAGNAGNTIRYIVGSPSTGEQTISVAALDSKQNFPGATVVLRPSGASQTWQDSNAGTLPSGSLPIQVLKNANGSVSLGCSESEYASTTDGSSKVAGNLVVSVRGTCARIYRAQAAFAHGAAGAAMINNSAGYPSFEGDIMSCIPGATADNANGRPCEQAVPTNGICAKGTLTGTGAAARCVETPELVTWAFFGVRGTGTGAGTDGATLATSTSADSFAAATVPNPTANTVASFSSSGPRMGYDADGFVSPSGLLKPNLAAPGVSILSTGMGTGNGGAVLSGTSMAAPHVTGVAALALQSHPDWSPDDVRIAMDNTANPTLVTGWIPRNAGAGLVQPVGATRTQVVARSDLGEGSSLSFGAIDFKTDYTNTRGIAVRNLGTTPATFNSSAVKWASSSGSHTVSVTPASFTLAGGAQTVVQVTITVPASANSLDSTAAREIGGYVLLAPTGGTNGNASLVVPYYLLPRARSDVLVTMRNPFDKKHPATSAAVQNASAAVNGKADVFSLGGNGSPSKGAHGIRAAGVKTAVSGTDRLLTFAINSYRPNSTYVAGQYEYDVNITLDGNTSGTPDYTAFTADFGLVATGTRNGQLVVVVVKNRPPADPDNYPRVDFNATAPTEGTLALMPVLASTVGVTAAAPRFTYQVVSFFAPDDAHNSSTNIVDVADAARFNAFAPAVTASINSCVAPGCTASTGGLLPITLAPQGQAVLNLNINPAEWEQTPAAGVMVMSRENSNFSADQEFNSQAISFKIRK
jgi:minor extracellular serine protease Vpr